MSIKSKILSVVVCILFLTSCAQVDKAFDKGFHGALNSSNKNMKSIAVVSLLGNEFWNYGGGFVSGTNIEENINVTNWSIDEYTDRVAISKASGSRYKLLNPTKEQRAQLIKNFDDYKYKGEDLNPIKYIIPSEFDGLIVIRPMNLDRVEGGYGFYSYNMMGMQGECPYVSLSIEIYDLKSLDRTSFAPGHSNEYCADANTGIKVKNFSQYSSSELERIKASILSKISKDVSYASDILGINN